MFSTNHEYDKEIHKILKNLLNYPLTQDHLIIYCLLLNFGFMLILFIVIISGVSLFLCEFQFLHLKNEDTITGSQGCYKE